MPYPISSIHTYFGKLKARCACTAFFLFLPKGRTLLSTNDNYWIDVNRWALMSSLVQDAIIYTNGHKFVEVPYVYGHTPIKYEGGAFIVRGLRFEDLETLARIRAGCRRSLIATNIKHTCLYCKEKIEIHHIKGKLKFRASSICRVGMPPLSLWKLFKKVEK
ncbi:MAG: hypothetical protein KDH96_05975 [Candidatus Riesia sp.]|nr:hypothetical protein [Candidatus Riesia sp.]